VAAELSRRRNNMQQRRTSDHAAGARRRPRLTTPLGAVCVYALAIAATTAWPPLTHAAELLTAMGRAVLGVLALHAIHEGGHVLAGVAVGLPLQSVSLGPLTVLRERRAGRRAGRLVWAVNRSWKRFAGCVEREVEPAPGLRAALTATAAGGPLASVAGGALLLLLPDAWQDVGYASVVIGALNALPVHLLGQASDGMIVLRLWSRRPAHVAWRTQFCGADATPDAAAAPLRA
jgi:hypothetical protein